VLDHFESVNPADYEAGFPYHPHRGIKTVTIVRQGEVRHGDSLGHRGTIGAGDIQWMTSGSGILHEEMPQVRAEGIAGLQLWLNLPAREKMSRPKYRDLGGAQLTETGTDGGATIRVIAGEAGDGRLVGPVEGLAVAPKFVDVRLPPGTTFRETVPRGHTTFAYVDQGVVRFGPEQTPAHAPALVVFGDGDVVEASAGPGGGRFLLAAAAPAWPGVAPLGRQRAVPRLYGREDDGAHPDDRRPSGDPPLGLRRRAQGRPRRRARRVGHPRAPARRRDARLDPSGGGRG